MSVGRITTSDVVPGMSGAPVIRDSDGAVTGVVSARYNSADGWLAGGLGNRQVACAYRDPGENTCRWVCLTASLSAIAVAAEQEEVPRRCGRPGGANRDDPAGNPEADLPADAAGSAPDFRPLVLTGLDSRRAGPAEVERRCAGQDDRSQRNGNPSLSTVILASVLSRGHQRART